MSFILAHLALYPNIQSKVYDEVRSAWPHNEDVVAAEDVRNIIFSPPCWYWYYYFLVQSFQDMGKFVSVLPHHKSFWLVIFNFQEYTLAVFRENLRHFPVAPRLPKIVRKDTILHSRARFSTGPGSESISVVVPKDSLVVGHISALNRVKTWSHCRLWTSWEPTLIVSWCT